MALSGAVAGLGGASDVGDIRHVLDPKGLSQAGYGYAGIVVAALARLNPIAVVFVSMLIGGLTNAGRALQGPDFPAGLVGTLQGLLLFFTLGGEVFARYRIRRRATGRPPRPVDRPGRGGRRREQQPVRRHRRRRRSSTAPRSSTPPSARCSPSAPACSTSASRG